MPARGRSAKRQTAAAAMPRLTRANHSKITRSPGTGRDSDRLSLQSSRCLQARRFRMRPTEFRLLLFAGSVSKERIRFVQSGHSDHGHSCGLIWPLCGACRQLRGQSLLDACQRRCQPHSGFPDAGARRHRGRGLVSLLFVARSRIMNSDFFFDRIHDTGRAFGRPVA